MKDQFEMNRRRFIAGSASLAGLTLAGCEIIPDISGPVSRLTGRPRGGVFEGSFQSKYGARPNEQFPIPAVKPGQLDRRFRRRLVNDPTGEKPGTVVVDTRRFYLYHVERDGAAMRYGVGLGRQGFEWSGKGVIKWKRKWPTWTPPAEMIAREPKLAKWSAENGGQPPGLRNPLGARALYIFQGGRDTLYRLHGTPETHTIGKAVSSGCVRLVNQDVIDLYNRVRPGSPILVR